jgi:type II secretory pathway pseudopilin PulG
VILRPRPARRPGLSLLEILLSLAIFLMSLVAIGGLVESGSDRGMSAAMQAAGTRLAQSKLAEVEAGAIPVSSGGQGTFDDEPEWNWSIEPGSAAVPNVYPVTVRVWRDYGGGRYEVVLTQMVFDPAQMGNASEAPKPTTSSTGSQPQTGSGTTSSSGGTGS